MIVGAGCLWGTMGLFVRRMGDMGLRSMEIVEARSILSAIMLLVLVLIRDRQLLKVNPRNLWTFAGTGIFSMVFFNVCYFSTIRQMNLSAAAILLYTAPIFVMLLSLMIFREPMTGRKVLALALAFGGCCLVSGLASAAEGLTAVGLLLGLGSGIGYALYSIFSRFALNRGVGSITITVYTFLFAAVGGAFFTDFGSILEAFRSQGPGLLGFLAVYCIVTTVAPYLLYTTGLRYVENGPASVMASVEPVMATLLGLVAFGEKPTLTALLGMALVLGALILLSTGGKGKTL